MLGNLYLLCIELSMKRSKCINAHELGRLLFSHLDDSLNRYRQGVLFAGLLAALGQYEPEYRDVSEQRRRVELHYS